MCAGILLMLFDWPTWLIVVLLFGAMCIANEAGYRAGHRNLHAESDLSRTVSNTLKGSVLGLVALLLGFSFSATTSRYDLRQRLALDQANAIGTAYLRAGLLDEPSKAEVQGILQQYVAVRLKHSLTGQDPVLYANAEQEIERLLSELWAAVEAADQRDPDRVRNAMLVPAVNEVIDLSSTRAWANRNHLPDPVLVLLLASVVTSSVLIGHSSGQAGRRHPTLWMASNLIFALVLFVVLDFDRPKRGLIKVDQTPLIELNRSINLPAQH